jgi:protein-L-isoaspartate(D-aspartate) O-methyltransferase
MPHSFRRISAIALFATLIAAVAPIAGAQNSAADNGKQELPPKERLAAEVYTVERIKPLLDEAFERLMQLGLRNVKYRAGDGSLGWPEKAPFDRILISAGAPTLPEELLRTQLVDGGIAILPVGPLDRQVLVEVRREGLGLKTTDICLCRFVKLVGENAWSEPE